MKFEQALTAMKEGKKVTNSTRKREGSYVFLQKGIIQTETLDIDSPEFEESDVKDMIDGSLTNFNGLPIKYFLGDDEAKENSLPKFVSFYETRNLSTTLTLTHYELLREDWQIVE